eukprot:7165630-Prorocentrum_lima.AAC.1
MLKPEGSKLWTKQHNRSRRNGYCKKNKGKIGKGVLIPAKIKTQQTCGSRHWEHKETATLMNPMGHAT